MHLTPFPCPNPDCSDFIPVVETTCRGCGHQDVGYPNVRYANDPAEVAELDARVDQAFAHARAKGAATVLQAFEGAVGKSWAITVMAPIDLRVIASENRLWASYYKHTRGAGSRIAERNKWDMNRGANDQKVNPDYYQEINYAALSLTDYGSGWYGGCHVKLASERIRSRTSVFWANPFNFLEAFVLKPDEIVPPGYRAPWERRDRLAVAKLHDRIFADTPDSAFSGILLEADPSRGDTDFIEVHVYGAVASSAFVQVTTDVNLLDEDELLDWESAKKKLGKTTIAVVEIGNA